MNFNQQLSATPLTTTTEHKQQQLMIVQKQSLQVPKNSGNSTILRKQLTTRVKASPHRAPQPCIVNWSRNLNTVQIKHNDNNKNLPKFDQKKQIFPLAIKYQKN